MTAARTRLWALPEKGRPAPFTRDTQPFESWQALRDNADRFDNDLNVVIWWDWYPADDDNPDDELVLMVAMPGMERVYPWSAPVTRDEEPEIRAWLQKRLRRLTSFWQIGHHPDPTSQEQAGQEPPSDIPLQYNLPIPPRDQL